MSNIVDSPIKVEVRLRHTGPFAALPVVMLLMTSIFGAPSDNAMTKEDGNDTETATLQSLTFGPHDVVDAKKMASLASFSALESLEFSDLSDEDMKRLPVLGALKTLKIQGIHNGFSPEAFAAAARQPRLETLDITGLYTDECIAQLKPLATLKRLALRPLFNYSMAVTDATLKVVSEMPSLEYLELCTGEFTDTGLAVLVNMPRLRSLILPNTVCYEAAIENFGKIVTLEELHIRVADVTDQKISALGSCSSLKKLTLSIPFGISREALSHLCDKITRPVLNIETKLSRWYNDNPRDEKIEPDARIHLDLYTFMDFAYIKAGHFMMGRNDGELDSCESESPRHEVTLSRSLFMSQCEVTMREWEIVMGTRPWDGQPDVGEYPDSPAVYVSWDDAQAFAQKLGTHAGVTLRLPSEAEWEYAARSGSITRFYWGNDPGYAQINDYAWWQGNAVKTEKRDNVCVPAQKRPNTWGLYDMCGNVWEWCQDWTHDNYNGAPSDGSAWELPQGTRRVIRGGGWGSSGKQCRLANRDNEYPSDRHKDIGFRLVMQEPDESRVMNSPIIHPSSVAFLPATSNTETLAADTIIYVPEAAQTFLEKRLDDQVSIDFENVHLIEVIEFMANRCGLNFAVDWRAVAPPPSPCIANNGPAAFQSTFGKNCVTDGIVQRISLTNASIRAALTALLSPLRLSYRVEPYNIWISSPALLDADSGLPGPDMSGASKIAALTLLKSPASLEFKDIRIEEFLEFVSDTWGLNMVLDSRVVAPQDYGPSGLPTDSGNYVTNGLIVYVNYYNMPLGAVLSTTLRPLNLTYKVNGDIVWISSYALMAPQTKQVK